LEKTPSFIKCDVATVIKVVRDSHYISKKIYVCFFWSSEGFPMELFKKVGGKKRNRIQPSAMT